MNVVIFANEKLGRGRFKLIIEDDKCNGKDAVTAAKKLVEVDKVKGVIGYGCSGALLAAAPIFERAKVPAIGTESSAAKISQAGDYIFRTQPSDAAGVKLLYDYLQKQHKIFGALSAQTDFCQGIAQDLEGLAADGTLKTEFESVLSSERDYKSALLRLRSRKIDGLLLNAQDEGGAWGMLRQARELGIRVPVYTFYIGASEAFFKLAGSDAEGVISVDVPALNDLIDEQGRELFKEFTARYGPMKAWDYGFATTFEAFRALTDALSRSDSPQQYLLETKFNGLFGPYSFDKNGDVVGLTLKLKRNEGGVAKALN